MTFIAIGGQTPVGRTRRHKKILSEIVLTGRLQEQMEDRYAIHSFSLDLEVAAKELLTHLREELATSLLALNRAIALGNETPALSKAYFEFQEAAERCLKLRQFLKQKISDLRTHEELMTTIGREAKGGRLKAEG